jgi:hypothetical protein
MASIFDKPALLRPATMRAVAQRRFEDAETLAETKSNARANGVIYLLGIAIDILLKAMLVERFPRVAQSRESDLTSEDDRRRWRLIWRSHQLADMLDELAGLEAAIKRRGDRAGQAYNQWLKTFCGEWTIHVRYSSSTAQMDEAVRQLDRVRVLKEVLR